jgi:hypothetical protein
MYTHFATMMILVGVVLTAAVQCGYSQDMLTTKTTDGDGGAMPPVDSAEEDDANEPTTFEITDTETATETPDNSESDSDLANCSHGEISPSEVLLIGDSWISLPGPRVGELARAAGVLEIDEDYVYRAVVGATIESIVEQYDSHLASGDDDVKVVIMNGGAVDTYGVGGAEESVSHVVETFTRFLEKLADEGAVEHVIYALYSEGSTIPGVAELRPRMRAACAESEVRCLFLDLQPLWEGHPEYTSADTINPSSAGQDVIAEAIWQLMQDNCIAQ